MSQPQITRYDALLAAIRLGDSGASEIAVSGALASLLAGLTGASTPAATGTPDGLAALPVPQLIEPLDFEAILTRRKADLIAAVATERALAIAGGRSDIVADLDGFGEYLMLESTPETILLEEAAYAEMLLRNRLNVMYTSRLIYFGTGPSLDNDAEDSGVTRLAGEGDAALRRRVRIKNRGSSAAGPDDWWRYHAMQADDAVEDVAVTRVQFPFPAPGERRGALTLSVLSTSVDGVPSEATLAAVRAVVTSPAVRGSCTEVTVRAAPVRTVDIAANVWLRPDAAAGTFGGLQQRLTDAWAASRALGWDVAAAWVIAQLMAPGVQRVELVGFSDVIIADNEAPRLGTITLTNSGRAF